MNSYLHPLKIVQLPEKLLPISRHLHEKFDGKIFLTTHFFNYEKFLDKYILLISENHLAEPYKTKIQDPVYRVQFSIYLQNYIREQFKTNLDVGYYNDKIF